jgi:hypothetical protein
VWRAAGEGSGEGKGKKIKVLFDPTSVLKKLKRTCIREFGVL